MVCAGIVKEIPVTAVKVKVTNVSSPSFMKIYDKEDYTKRLNVISEKLILLMKKQKVKAYDSKVEARMGDLVIVHNRLDADCVFSAWWTRGVIGNYDDKSLKFNVFLVDHGYTIKIYRSDFIVIPKSLIANDYLTCSVGINNLIPAVPGIVASSYGEDTGLSSEWSDIAIKITRDCIAASSETYFDYQAVDEKKTKYGELYLILENEVVSLSEILVSKKLAIYLTKDVSRLIKNPNYDIKKVSSVDDGIIVEVESNIVESPRKHRVMIRKHNDSENDSKAEDTSYEMERIQRRTVTSKGTKSIRYLGEDCQQILVHSNIHCKPLIKMADAQFPVHIQKVLQRTSIVNLRRIQSYMCPAISKGLNVLAIGPPNCGKTIGFLMPIVSSIALCKKVLEGNNVMILILCSSTSNVLNVKSLCSELLERYTDIRCVAAFNGRPNRSLVADIYNGCQILIATPPFLVRFINRDDEHRKLLNFENLSHLVIDGIDVILNKYYEPFQQLFTRNVMKGTKKRDSLENPPLQIVAVSRHWSSLLNGFAKQCMTDSYVCIGSYMEAAIYGRIKPKLYIVDSGLKMERVKDLLGDETSMIKTIIICHDSKEARALNEFLSKSQKTRVACESMMREEIDFISEYWKSSISGLYPILICTDEVLVNLNITDADWLIHYSVSLRSKTQFYFRFSTLMKNLRKGNGKNKVTIIIDEKNDIQLYGVVTVLERCGVKLSPQFMENVMRIVATLDGRKKMYPICDNVKAFGYCPKKNSCPYRHCILASIDTPVTPIKIGDSVKLIVINVHNATHFTARVIEYISPQKEVTKYSAKEYTRFSAMIQTYYADKNNRRCCKQVQVGDICALELLFDNFQRVKVLNIVEKDCDEVPIAVELKCIDTGEILPKKHVRSLMEIPEDLAKHDTHIVEIFLANLAPYDDEHEWNQRAIDDAKNWFKVNKQLHSYILGKVCLHVADTFWVDPLEIHTKIIGHPDLVSASLKWHMIKLKHAVQSKNHLSLLYELCEIGMVKNANGESIVSTISSINRSKNGESDSISN